METVFSVVLLILVLLFYFSNKHNKVNKWCAIAGFIFWLGIEKEAVLYNIIPVLERALDNDTLHTAFMPMYSVQTWVLYSLATPTAVIFSLHFSGMEQKHPNALRISKICAYIPALILAFVFPPLDFRVYQLGSLSFWVTFGVYNFIFVGIYIFFLIRGVQTETDKKKKMQKKYIRLVTLPPVVFWLLSVFLTHPFQISKLYKLWEVNAVILAVCLIAFVVMAFREGVMGLKLSGQTYNWNTDMKLIGKGAEYTHHMLKNQTSKMEWCIDNLKAQFERSGDEQPEELAILSRSIAALKSYVEKIKRHSQEVQLLEEHYKLTELFAEAIPVALRGESSINTQINVPGNVLWLCDKSHMTEALANILINAAEAIRGEGTIDINGVYDDSGYLLRITDSGVGMDEEEQKNMFTPYFTTKSTEKNFGLGLAYCHNVITKHDGTITAQSKPGKGTTISIAFPSKRVTGGAAETGEQYVR